MLISPPSTSTLPILYSFSLRHGFEDRIHLPKTELFRCQTAELLRQALKSSKQIRRSRFGTSTGLGLCRNKFDINNDSCNIDEVADMLKIEQGIFEPVRTSEQELLDGRVDEAEKRNLIPPQWKFLQKDLNKSKKERRKETKLQVVDFAKNKELMERSIMRANIGSLQNKRLKGRKINALERVQIFDSERRGLQNHNNHWVDGHVVLPEDVEPDARDSENMNAKRSMLTPPERVTPRNPRSDLGNETLADLAKRMEDYEQEASQTLNVDDCDEAEMVHKLLSEEEKTLRRAKVPDLKKLTGKKWLLLHTLSASGRTVLVDELLTHGVDINAMDKDGLTALNKAIASGKETIVKQLIRAGADVLVKDKDGASLLHYAAHYGNFSIGKVLLKHNVDVNHPDDGLGHLEWATMAPRYQGWMDTTTCCSVCWRDRDDKTFAQARG